MVDLISHLSGSGGFTSDVNAWNEAAVISLATKIELQDLTTQKMGAIIQEILKSVLSEYQISTGEQGATDAIKKGEEKLAEDTKESKNLQSIKAALKNGNLKTMVSLIE